MRILRVLVAVALVVAGVVSTVGTAVVVGGNGVFAFWPTPPLDIPPPDIAWVDITIANAQDVSATVVRAADQLIDVTATIGGQVFPSLPAAPDLLSSNSKFELFATVAMTGAPVTEPCAMSGTVTVLGGYAGNDPVTLADGDLYDLVFDVCADGDGYNINGVFSVFVDELNGDSRTDVFRLRYFVHHMAQTTDINLVLTAMSVSLSGKAKDDPNVILNVDMQWALSKYNPETQSDEVWDAMTASYE